MSKIIANLVEGDSSSKTVLKEAADKYEQMIVDVNIQLEGGRSVNIFEMDSRLQGYVTKIRKTLKRQDRIIWALRYFKKLLLLEALWTVKHDADYITQKFGAPPLPDQPLITKKVNQLAWLSMDQFEEYNPELQDQMDFSPYVAMTSMDDLLGHLEHYLGVADVYSQREPNNAIVALVFDKQTYGEIMRSMRRAELNLAKKYEGNLRESGKRILEFPNGWVWFDLQKPFCRDEGQAMGHCGNSPRSGQNNLTVLTLREPIDIDGDVLWRPHCTFILDKNTGALDERKGRANAKPKASLHKYIVPLLRLPIIKKLVSGHWMSSNDFNMSDLTPAEYHEMYFEKPALFTLEKYNPNFGAETGFKLEQFKTEFMAKKAEERKADRIKRGLPPEPTADEMRRERGTTTPPEEADIAEPGEDFAADPDDE